MLSQNKVPSLHRENSLLTNWTPFVECTSKITRKTEIREIKRNGGGTHSLHRTGGDDEEGGGLTTQFTHPFIPGYALSLVAPPFAFCPFLLQIITKGEDVFSQLFPVPITLRIFDFAFSSHTSVEFSSLYHPVLPPLLPYYSASHEMTERKHQRQIIIDVSFNTP